MAIFGSLGPALAQGLAQAGVGYGQGQLLGEREAYRRQQAEIDKEYKKALLRQRKKEDDPDEPIRKLAGNILEKAADARFVNQDLREYFRQHPEAAAEFDNFIRHLQDVNTKRIPASQFDMTRAIQMSRFVSGKTLDPNEGQVEPQAPTAGAMPTQQPSLFQQVRPPTGQPPLTVQRGAGSLMGGISGPATMLNLDPRANIPPVPPIFAGEAPGGLPWPPPAPAPTAPAPARPAAAPKPRTPQTRLAVLEDQLDTLLTQGPPEMPSTSGMTPKQASAAREEHRAALSAYDRQTGRLQKQIDQERRRPKVEAEGRAAGRYYEGRARLVGAQGDVAVSQAILNYEKIKMAPLQRQNIRSQMANREKTYNLAVRQADDLERNRLRQNELGWFVANTGRANQLQGKEALEFQRRRVEFLINNFDKEELGRNRRAGLALLGSIMRANESMAGVFSSSAAAGISNPIAWVDDIMKKTFNREPMKDLPAPPTVKAVTTTTGGAARARTGGAQTTPGAPARAAGPTLSADDIARAKRWNKEGLTKWREMFAKARQDPESTELLRAAYRKTNNGKEWAGSFR